MSARRTLILAVASMVGIVGACLLLGNLPAICFALSVVITAGVLAANWHGTRA